MENISIRKLLNVVGFLLIILLIITLLLGFFKIDEIKKMTLAKEKEIEESYKYHGETVKEDVIIPNKVANFFSKYNGRYSTIDIYTNFNTLLKYKLPHYYELCQSNNSETVYQSDISDIKYWFGCADGSSFEKFINEAKNKIKFSQIELDTYSFEEEKTSFNGITTKCNLIIKYKNKANYNEVKELKVNVELFEKIDGMLMKINIIE